MTDNNLGENIFQFQYGQSIIDYHLIYEDRVKLAITVQPDKSVLVKAPLKSKLVDIQKNLLTRGQWISKQIKYFDKFHPLQPERKYVSGETHYYLGRQYRLRIRKAKEETAKLIGKFFIVNTSNPEDMVQVKFLMQQWMADHAKILLDRKVQEFALIILGENFNTIRITYKMGKHRWGYWNPDGSLTFNVAIIKTPITCIEYVIVHELCHLIFPNHDKEFYRKMKNILPDWKDKKEKLELFGVR